MSNSPSAIHSNTIAAYLAADRPQNPVEHLGVLTPEYLDGFDAELEAFRLAAAAHDLSWLRSIRVKGEDRERWLNGMVTNAVTSLKPGEGNYNFLLNAQGRILGDLELWRSHSGELELVLPANQVDAVLAHLDHFIIMDDVELELLPAASVLGLAGPKALAILAVLGLPVPEPLHSAEAECVGLPVRIRRSTAGVVPHFALYTSNPELIWTKLKAAGAARAGAAAWNALRILEGVPAYGMDILPADLPQETGRMDALNFNKGCYLGQEIVERIRSRGAVHRHIRLFELAGEPPVLPATLFQDGKSVGELTSATAIPLNGARRLFALGHLRDEALMIHKPILYDEGSAVIAGTSPFAANP